MWLDLWFYSLLDKGNPWVVVDSVVRSAGEHFISFLKCVEAAAVMGSHMVEANKAGVSTGTFAEGKASLRQPH